MRAIKVGDFGIAKGMTCSVVAIEGNCAKVRFSHGYYDWVTKEEFTTSDIEECMNDAVNHPAHYTDGKIEVIEYIEDKNLGFCLGNAVKYISRAGKKEPDKRVEDLKKAIWYLQRQILEWSN